jgi:hypothetical protein
MNTTNTRVTVSFVLLDTDIFPNRKKLVREKILRAAVSIRNEMPLAFQDFSYKEGIAGFAYEGKRPSKEELAKAPANQKDRPK